MGLSASKRVKSSLSNSAEFDSACDSTFSHCLDLTQHAFPGVLPYQLNSAAEHLHGQLSTHALIQRWVNAPPDRSQVDSALRLVRSRSSSKSGDEILGPVMFKDWALELYSDAVLSGAGKALLLRVPVGVAGIAGIGAVTHAGGQVVGTAVGAYSLGVAGRHFLRELNIRFA
ncbi:hypothetical protein PIB30_066140 [Stylosanthes scabra]|uniref:Uncharacterized protein n=1 Tax=Stylosanthes scabra TaxID=79078 RepID=A0ABU6QMT8_9FABA|nr:hypothetical protein [Stylosanthes scabra]